MLALIVGKVVAVVNKLPLLRRLDGKPLIYPVFFKATVYSVFVLIVRSLEHWVPALIEAGSLLQATYEVISYVAWRIFAMGQIWIFVLFVIYIAVAAIIALFGMTSGQLMTAFFKQHPAKIV